MRSHLITVKHRVLRGNLMDSKVLCKGTPARSLSGNIIPRLNQPTFPRRHSASEQALLLGSTAAQMLWVPCPVPGLAHRPHVTHELALLSHCSPFTSIAPSPLLPGALYPSAQTSFFCQIHPLPGPLGPRGLSPGPIRGPFSPAPALNSPLGTCAL